MASNVLTRVALGLAGVVPTGPRGPQGTPPPAAPAAPSGMLLVAQWALFRRGASPFNQSPVASPTQAPTSTGQVVGDLHATDPDGDRLTYVVVAPPSQGEVAVAADETFVYTPSPELARTGGADAFTVLIRDAPGAPGLSRYTDLLRGVLARHPVLADRLFGPHGVRVTVPITVAPRTANTPPSVPTTTPAPSVQRGSGVVSGNLGVQDLDGDQLVFTVPEQPAAGAVSVDPLTGSYTFTPTSAARRAAAGTPGPDTVTFTVLVSDGRGEALPVVVTAPVDPGPAEVVTAIPVAPGASSLVTSPDGTRIYVIGQNASTEAPVLAAARTLAAPTDVSPLVAMSTGTTISIIDAGSNTLISTVTLPGTADGLTFSPDGSHAFVTTYDSSFRDGPSTVTVIGVATDTVVATLEAEGTHGDVYFSPDGRYAYLSDYLGDRVFVVDLGSDITTTIAVARPQYLTFSPDGRRAYMPSSSDGTTVIIDTGDHSVIGSVPGYGQPVVGPDGRYVYVVDYQYVDGTVTVIDVADDSVAALIPVGGYPTNIQFGAGARYAFVDSQNDGRHRLFVIDTLDLSATSIELGTDPQPMQLSADGRRGYMVDQIDGTVTMIDTEHGTLLGAVETTDRDYSYVRNPGFDPSGRRFYVLDGGRLTIIDSGDDTVTTLAADGRLGFTPDGAYAYVLGYGDGASSALTLVSTADDTVRRLTGPGYASAVTFSPDSSVAFVSAYDDTVTVLDTAGGESRVVEVGPGGGFPMFSPDGGQAFFTSYGDVYAGGGAQPKVTVVDTATDTVWTVPTAEWPGQVTFGPDGRSAYVVSGRSSEGSTVTVIDRTDGTVTSFTGPPYATDVAFSPDGRFAYLLGYGDTLDDGSIVVIDLADGSRSDIPVPAATGVRFSADGQYAYVLNSRDGTATVILLGGGAVPSGLAPDMRSA
ncbi:Ig-like domain-containing protein [Actinomycetospora soli]|uniref:Ig-like domain-containing protein n=1 Tax=Actinomycetospora soli TaxID=2893887 RepID=UPI001E29411E|nr:Ig-like domain-containing protein [Actinomycetospora soli]MCD2187823.1 Ig-like domain-containing protein [Actinomycetospora soli]